MQGGADTSLTNALLTVGAQLRVASDPGEAARERVELRERCDITLDEVRRLHYLFGDFLESGQVFFQESLAWIVQAFLLFVFWHHHRRLFCELLTIL